MRLICFSFKLIANQVVVSVVVHFLFVCVNSLNTGVLSFASVYSLLKFPALMLPVIDVRGKKRSVKNSNAKWHENCFIKKEEQINSLEKRNEFILIAFDD